MSVTCSNCQHTTDEGVFCIHCGAKLPEKIQGEIGSSQPLSSSQGVPYGQAQFNQGTEPTSNSMLTKERMQKASESSKMYVSYVMDNIRSPYQRLQTISQSHLIQALVTMGIYALLIPLILYIQLQSSIGLFGDVPFFETVVKPFLGYVVFLLLIGTITFGVIVLNRYQASFSEVIARFGTILLPFVGLLILAILMSLLNIGMFMLLLLIAFTGAIFVAPLLVLLSYHEPGRERIDLMYSILLIIVGAYVTIRIMSGVLLPFVGQLFRF
ncbi:zinc ribbon domain-containing protein [Paenibacillus sp. SC116]|uniref:zinc ribbon domain-containing protein n=1 Tax=Paenibacillus sp. SC116 TaxID=2968986 RepID=UPI00215AA1EF|nr:zinc ribbon domain-containing protein [Paenibacillus sp. SC116]MCR8842248.1 zinc ribbon domain-containing protein [Paenibacillus sp. SC116]